MISEKNCYPTASGTRTVVHRLRFRKPIQKHGQWYLGNSTWNLKMDLWRTIFLYTTIQWFSGSMLFFPGRNKNICKLLGSSGMTVICTVWGRASSCFTYIVVSGKIGQLLDHQ